MLTLFLNPTSGVINRFLSMLGGDTVNFFRNRPCTNGFTCSAASGRRWAGEALYTLPHYPEVDRALLEAADIDGASRLQKIWYINLPVLVPTILILLILNCGSPVKRRV